MRANFVRNLVILILLLLGSQVGYPQGTFVNLDFENPILPLIPDSQQNVPITNALPAWTGSIDGIQVTKVIYNNVSAGSPAISFHGPGSTRLPYHGNYSVVLQGGSVGGVIVVPAIAQVGQIPPTAKSLLYYADNMPSLAITFAGQPIPKYNLTGGAFGYQQYGVDVSLFAGQTGELRFTGGGGNLDFIQFSSQAIPEPSVMAFGTFGMGLLGWLWRKRAFSK